MNKRQREILARADEIEASIIDPLAKAHLVGALREMAAMGTAPTVSVTADCGCHIANRELFVSLDCATHAESAARTALLEAAKEIEREHTSGRADQCRDCSKWGPCVVHAIISRLTTRAGGPHE